MFRVPCIIHILKYFVMVCCYLNFSFWAIKKNDGVVSLGFRLCGWGLTNQKKTQSSLLLSCIRELALVWNCMHTLPVTWNVTFCQSLRKGKENGPLCLITDTCAGRMSLNSFWFWPFSRDLPWEFQEQMLLGPSSPQPSLSTLQHLFSRN